MQQLTKLFLKLFFFFEIYSMNFGRTRRFYLSGKRMEK